MAGMKIGVILGFGAATPPDQIVSTAKAVEESGVHSIWMPEHVVFFREHESRYPYAADGAIPGRPDGVLEPLTALAYLAAHTERVRLGTGICLVPQRNPVYTARQVADVDFLSGGRVDFGVGIGWLREEFEALGVPWPRRAARTREYIEVMKRLWSDEVEPFDGEFYRLPECLHNPKPVQRPHPPIFFGGESDAALRRTADLGQGWFGFDLAPADLPERLKRLDDILAESGRTRDSLEIYASPYLRPLDRDMVRAYADLGLAQLIVPLFARNTDELARRLEAVNALMA